MLKAIWDWTGDISTIALHKCGYFGWHAKVDPGSKKWGLLDEWGISNRVMIEEYNERHPDAPLPNPYAPEKHVVAMEATTFEWQKKPSDFVEAPKPRVEAA